MVRAPCRGTEVGAAARRPWGMWTSRWRYSQWHVYGHPPGDAVDLSKKLQAVDARVPAAVRAVRIEESGGRE
jgi:hypothetical protein